MAPAGFLVNEQNELIYTCGDAGTFLRSQRGLSSSNILEMIHPELQSTLDLAITQASRNHQTIVYKDVHLHREDQVHLVTLTVTPIADKREAAPTLFIALDVGPGPALATSEYTFEANDIATQRIELLKIELHHTQEILQSTIEELEASNEEMQTTNEELVASNEELQSTNEELQSINEELYTVNAEYQLKNKQLIELDHDTANLLRSTNIGTVFLDSNYHIRNLTPAITQSINLLPQDTGRPMSHFASMLDITSDDLHQLFTQILQTREPIEREVRNHAGTYFSMQIRPFLTDLQDVQGVVVTLIDMTVQQQAQAASQRFRTALETSLDSILLLDCDAMCFADVNASACTTLGYSRDELLDMGPYDLRPMVSPEEIDQKIVLLRSGEQGPTVLESVYRGKDGSDLPVEVSTQAFVSEGCQYLLIMARDITERKRAEQVMQHYATELEQKNAELDRFAYAASHDLKTPLRAIENLATWIAEDVGDILPEASRTDLQTLRQRVQRMERLLNGLLYYARIGSESAETEVLDTHTLVEDIIDLLDPPPHIAVDIESSLPTLTTSKVPLDLVLHNLLGNAIKHHKPSGGHVTVLAREADTVVEFLVVDDGPGIAPAFHQKVFEMFETLQPLDEVEGSGMGLALVKKTVEVHGGNIELESAEGCGTTFRFTWPKL